MLVYGNLEAADLRHSWFSAMPEDAVSEDGPDDRR